METLLAIAIGILFASGLYMLLRRSLIKLIIGIALISQAANLVIFTAAGIFRYQPPIIHWEENFLKAPYADPLPQALILTAIVISFGVLAFSMVLFYRVYDTVQSGDVDVMKVTEK